MNTHEKINYLEFPSSNIIATKKFFKDAFGWSFEDYGPEYTSFSDEGVNGGFFKSDLCATSDKGSVLVIFYSTNLEASQTTVMEAGGQITKAIFSFPGGRRFHFTEPSGNEFAVWSDIDV